MSGYGKSSIGAHAEMHEVRPQVAPADDVGTPTMPVVQVEILEPRARPQDRARAKGGAAWLDARAFV